MPRVLLTGASGFVGKATCALLKKRGYVVRVALRSNASRAVSEAEPVCVGDIGARTDWRRALEDVDTVVHLAARAHIVDAAHHDDDVYLETNARGTDSLARTARQMGVRRFVYLSSVKVNGEQTYAHPFTAADQPRPEDIYGRSKWLGEKAVLDAAQGSRMQSVIVRSPLVYGPGVRANFLSLVRLVERGWPLPFGAINNIRSLVSIWNLTDLILCVIEHPEAIGNVWMVSDGMDLSTPELVRMIAAAMRRRIRLVGVPIGILRTFGRLAGLGSTIDKLCGSLAVDIGPTRSRLRWQPPLGVEESIARTTYSYLKGQSF